MIHFNLSTYVNKIVKIVLEKNPEVPYVYGTLIALLQYDAGIKAYVLNHPYNIRTKTVPCGLAGFAPSDVKSISIPNNQELTKWFMEYVLFHNQVLKDQGYDICEIDPHDIEIGLDPK